MRDEGLNMRSMRSGCINYIFRIGAAVVSAILLTLGALVLVFGAFDLDSSGGTRTVITTVAALGAIYLFVRVGKDILRDLRDDGASKEDPPHDDPTQQ